MNPLQKGIQESELPTQHTDLPLADCFASIWAESSEVSASSLCTGPSTGEALLVGGYCYLLQKVEVDEPNMFQKWWCYTLMSSYVVRLNGRWIDLILLYIHPCFKTHTHAIFTDLDVITFILCHGDMLARVTLTFFIIHTSSWDHRRSCWSWKIIGWATQGPRFVSNCVSIRCLSGMIMWKNDEKSGVQL